MTFVVYMYISSIVKMERFMLIELHFSEEDNESNYVYKYLEPVLAVFMADPLILMQM